jgi:hypothetical protein
MKIFGTKKLLKQMKDLPDEVHQNMVKSIDRTVKLGVSKAKSFAEKNKDTGKFQSDINGHVEVKDKEIFGFINLYDGGLQDGLAASSINYGWGNMPYGLHVRALTKNVIGKRHKRSVKRFFQKAIKDAMNG